ncbi:MAG: hypothetical protein K0S42_2981 [Microvirga sp.]|nr:hypothetical protein [Microvirga sp.]
MICDGTAQLESGRVMFARGWNADGTLHSPPDAARNEFQ